MAVVINDFGLRSEALTEAQEMETGCKTCASHAVHASNAIEASVMVSTMAEYMGFLLREAITSQFRTAIAWRTSQGRFSIDDIGVEIEKHRQVIGVIDSIIEPHLTIAANDLLNRLEIVASTSVEFPEKPIDFVFEAFVNAHDTIKDHPPMVTRIDQTLEDGKSPWRSLVDLRISSTELGEIFG